MQRLANRFGSVGFQAAGHLVYEQLFALALGKPPGWPAAQQPEHFWLASGPAAAANFFVSFGTFIVDCLQKIAYIIKVSGEWVELALY